MIVKSKVPVDAPAAAVRVDIAVEITAGHGAIRAGAGVEYGIDTSARLYLIAPQRVVCGVDDVNDRTVGIENFGGVDCLVRPFTFCRISPVCAQQQTAVVIQIIFDMGAHGLRVIIVSVFTAAG